MFGIIGIGQAGGSIAAEGSKLNYPTIAINFSQKDLDSCEGIENKIKLVGSEGVGRSRSQAINLMQDNWEIVINYVKQKFAHPSIEVIFVVFSTSGGSGSGISPLVIEMLTSEMSDKVFVACPIIPDKSEVIINQMNCLEAFQELANLDNAIFPIDNEKMKNRYSAKNRLYQHINSLFIQHLDMLLHYTEQESTYTNLDKRDLLTIFKTKGIGLISEVDLREKDIKVQTNNNNWLSNAIQHSWKKGIFANNSTKIIEKAGIIIDGDESLMEELNLQQVFSSVKSGMPLSLFEGFYKTNKNKIITILTGLSWCNERLEEIDELIDESNENIQEIMSKDSENVYKPKNRSMRIPTSDRKEAGQKRSSLDILKKYKR